MKHLPTTPAPAGLARRSFLTGLAVSLPIAATVATPALAASDASSRTEIDSLYEEWIGLAARSRELREQFDAAEASMPWWARPGHEFLNRDRTWTGAIVGWPAICDDDGGLPSLRFIRPRPSPSDIREDCEELVRCLGEDKRSAVRAEYRLRMRQLIARLRRQREEEQKVGLPGIMAKMDAISERIGEIDDALENISVSVTDLPQKIAALILINAFRDLRRTDFFADFSSGSVASLGAVRPLVTGLIREHADYVAENCYKPMETMPFWVA